jgi:Ca2+-binding RTX toxin-like protein
MSFQTNRPGRRRAAATAILAALVGMPTAARAAVTCSFSGGTVQVTLGAAEDEASIVRDGDDIVVRDATAEIPCGSPTVNTVDAIRAADASSGTTEFTIDLSGGMFEPGQLDEGDGTSEIEFAIELGAGFPDRLTIVGTGGADDILLRADGVVLNNGDEQAPLAADVDVTTTGVEEHAVVAGEGADEVSGDGPMIAPFPGRLFFDGQGGDDTLTGGTAADELTGGDGDDDVVGGDAADDLSGGAGLDELDGGDGDDELFGGGDDDQLAGGLGGDRLDGGGGGDSETAGSGDDVFDQGGDANGPDDLEGDTGFDVVAYDLRDGPLDVTVGLGANDGEAGEGDDVGAEVEAVLGGSGGDTLVGNDDGNVLRGGAGADAVDGGDGDDVVDGDAGNDALEGGDGEDTASFFGAPAVTASLASGSASGDGNDALFGFEHLEGGAHGDALSGDGGANVLTGRGGPDSLSGGAGNDDLLGGDGSDAIAGEAGNDMVRGNGGSDTASFVGSVADAVDGGSGDDAIAGGDGQDTLTGASGSDRFLEGEQSGPNGADAITGGPAADLVTYGGRKNRVRVTVGAAAGDGQRREGDRVGADVERVRGTTRQDVLIGNGAKNVLIGRAGDDTLKGRGGRDRLIGGGGNDRLDGGPGPDVCRGGGGKNVLRGCGKKQR